MATNKEHDGNPTGDWIIGFNTIEFVGSKLMQIVLILESEARFDKRSFIQLAGFTKRIVLPGAWPVLPSCFIDVCDAKWVFLMEKNLSRKKKE